jgi:hypothetical protein
MATFITRVELHEAVWSDYSVLHGEMKKQGFSQSIKGDDGKVYALPTAEYEFDGDLTQAQVLERVKAAASKTNRAFGAIVTGSVGQTWFGLPFA